jgi:hypothetical protein
VRWETSYELHRAILMATEWISTGAVSIGVFRLRFCWLPRCSSWCCITCRKIFVSLQAHRTTLEERPRGAPTQSTTQTAEPSSRNLGLPKTWLEHGGVPPSAPACAIRASEGLRVSAPLIFSANTRAHPAALSASH